MQHASIVRLERPRDAAFVVSRSSSTIPVHMMEQQLPHLKELLLRHCRRSVNNTPLEKFCARGLRERSFIAEEPNAAKDLLVPGIEVRVTALRGAGLLLRSSEVGLELGLLFRRLVQPCRLILGRSCSNSLAAITVCRIAKGKQGVQLPLLPSRGFAFGHIAIPLQLKSIERYLKHGIGTIVRVQTDVGLTGIGEATESGSGDPAIAKVYEYVEWMTGRLVYDIEALRGRTYPEHEEHGRAMASAHSFLQVDILFGRAQNTSCWTSGACGASVGQWRSLMYSWAAVKLQSGSEKLLPDGPPTSLRVVDMSRL